MPRLSVRSTSKLNKAIVDSDDETNVEGKGVLDQSRGLGHRAKESGR